VPVAMLPAAYDSGVKAIRFPGGAWGDRNDLKSYHIDPFIAFTQQVGAIPTISVRLREGTPEQAADLVRYVNIEKGYGVTYWAIGNEPTLFAAELRQMGKADDYDTVQFNREWREFATAMKEVDPSIKLMGPEINQFNYDYDANPKDSADRDWMTEFLKANGDMVDVVTFHRYPFPRGAQQNVTIADLREHTREWTQTMVYLRGLIEELTSRDLPIAITEVNTHWNPAIGGEATPDSHYNAIWLAETLGQLMVQDVFMVNHWMLTSPGRQGGWGLIGRSEVRPSYYVFQLYRQFGTELLYANSGVPDVSLYAGRRDDGRLSLLIVNLADNAADVPVQLSSKRPQQAEMWQLDAEQKPESGTTFTWPTDDIISFPAQSVTLFLIEQSE
jgi:alpha-L-arabinofuranosidase